MKSGLLKILFLCLIGLGEILPLAAQAPLGGLSYEPQSGIDIEVVSPFKNLPSFGYTPIRIKIRNQSGRTQSWKFHFQSPQYFTDNDPRVVMEREFVVENQSERFFEVSVPLAPSRDRQSGGLQIMVSGFGIQNGMINSLRDYYSDPPTPYFIMSKSLSADLWNPLEKGLKTKNRSLSGSEMETEQLPRDWRSLSGVSGLFLKDWEWLRLNSEQRQTILQWLGQGGTLVFCLSQVTAEKIHPLQLPGSGLSFRDYGFGKIHFLKISEKPSSSEVSETIETILKFWNPVDDQVQHAYRDHWSLMDIIGNFKINVSFIIIFLALFAVVVAPINLFILAGSNRRHRLFWTTPSISLAGGVLIAILIIFQDGIGGRGYQFIAWFLMPENKTSILVQEQVARTGLLISRHFKKSNFSFLFPIPIEERTTARKRLYVHGKENFEGDWFSSRTISAHLLQEIVPTRATVQVLETKSDAIPDFISNAEVSFQKLYLIDENNRYWTVENVQAGEKRKLVPVGEVEYEDWWEKSCVHAGGRLQSLLKEVANRKGYFYAVTLEPEKLSIPTLSSVRWSPQPAVVLGKWQSRSFIP